MDYTQITALLKQRQDKFVETRTVIAAEVTRYLQSLNELSEDVRSRIVPPAGATPQEILPALWVEPFDEEAYKQQLLEFSKSVQSAKVVRDEINQEAIACLQSM